MMEILDKLVDAILKSSAGGVVPILLIIIGYLVWDKRKQTENFEATLKEYKDTVEKMQDMLQQKSSEEKEFLLQIVQKYQDGQLSTRDAMSEVKQVLQTVLITISSHARP